MCRRTTACNVSLLCEPANTDCRLSRGQIIDLPCLFCLGFWQQAPVFDKFLFFRSALLTLPLDVEDPKAAVIFSRSICLIVVSQMEVNNLSSALCTGLYMSPARYGKLLGGFAEMNRARSFLPMTRLILLLAVIYDTLNEIG